jgi:hypothetical protein
MGEWEADVEAFNLLLLAAGHALASAKLARVSLSLHPSACVLARSCLEAGTRALWLLHPDDPFQREARWLAHLETEISGRERLHRSMSKFPGSSSEDDGVTAVREFRDGVLARLPAGVSPPGRVPDIRTTLDTVGHAEKYMLYILLSQTAHGSHIGTGTYRRHLGTHKEFGEFVTAADWSVPLSTCWWFVTTPVIKMGERYHVSPETLLPVDLQAEFSRAQQALR